MVISDMQTSGLRMSVACLKMAMETQSASHLNGVELRPWLKTISGFLNLSIGGLFEVDK